MTNHSGFPGTDRAPGTWGFSFNTVTEGIPGCHETFIVKARKVPEKPGQLGHPSWKHFIKEFLPLSSFFSTLPESFTGEFQFTHCTFALSGRQG